MTNLDKILKNKRLTSALTGLTPQEFLDLLPLFAQTWTNKKQNDYRKNIKSRKRKPGGGRKGFLTERQIFRKKETAYSQKHNHRRHKRIGFLSKTEGGRQYDFSMLKEHAPPECIPITIKQHLDLGFKGYQVQFPYHKISMPDKKPRTRELCKAKKEKNTRKSRIRVLVEHVICGAKRFRITTDVFRNKLKGSEDKAMLISCGLWNYHLTMSR